LTRLPRGRRARPEVRVQERVRHAGRHHRLAGSGPAVRKGQV